jgi:hypothetical protein
MLTSGSDQKMVVDPLDEECSTRVASCFVDFFVNRVTCGERGSDTSQRTNRISSSCLCKSSGHNEKSVRVGWSQCNTSDTVEIS